jgi:glycosyltransferase involved in cell wall biosynthesis
VHVAYLQGSEVVNDAELAGATFHKLGAAGNHDPRILFELWNLIRRVKPDVVNTWLPQMDIAAGIVALATGTPWVVAERSNAASYTARRAKDRLLRPALGRWADAVIANSVAGRDLWSNILRRGSRAHVVRNALALREIDAAVPISREALDVGPDEKIVLFAGRLAPEKGIDVLLGLAELLPAHLRVAIIICGDGPLRDEVAEFNRQTAPSRRIKLLGYRHDIWSIMKISSAMISTSHFEGHPNAVLEAMACKCPLVVSDISAHREFLDASSAMIVPLNARAFADAIATVIDGSPEVDRMREVARRQAETLDPRNAAANYDAIYREAVAQRVSHPVLASRLERRV